MQIYMQAFPGENKPPRFYQLILQQDLLGGWTVIREWGTQGKSGRVKQEIHPSREAAVDAMIKLRDVQLARGFQVVYLRGDAPIS